ncbi:hypothetical protein B4129_3552 [Bacillus safensis]|nr:hypothetical protein B4129_3552 [Bacillus safensis]
MTHEETITIILLSVAVLGAAGWIVWQQRKNISKKAKRTLSSFRS